MLNSGFRKLAAGVAMAVGLGTGSAQATINSDGNALGEGTGAGELFFSIWDQANSISLTLDLNVDVQAFLANPLAGVSVQSDALQGFIAAGDQDAMIWNVGGLNNEFDGADFSTVFVVSTVNPSSSPAPFPGEVASNLANGLNLAISYIGAANAVIADDVAVLTSGVGYFGGGAWGTNFGNQLGFENDVDLASGETAAMAIIGGLPDGSATEVVANAALAQGFWSVDPGTGTVAFQPVPIPGAVWLFGSAILGLVGIRRRY